MMTPRQQLELRQILAQLDEFNRLPPAADKGAEPADAVCPQCRRTFTWSGMQLNDEGFHLLCTDCATRVQQQITRRRPLILFKMPGFYVVAVVMIAALLWLAGAGRLDPAAIKQADQRREWAMRRYPRLLVERAGTARKRADYLAAHDSPDEARRWAELAESSFREAAASWQGQPVENDLLAAAALMRVHQDQAAKAYDELAALAEKYPDTDRVTKTLCFQCGRLALELGKRNQGKKHLETVLELIWKRRRDFVAAAGELLGVAHAMADNPTAEMMRDVIIQAGNLRLPETALLQDSLALLRKHAIKSGIAAEIERNAGETLGMPFAEDEDEEAPPGALTIEDLDEGNPEE